MDAHELAEWRWLYRIEYEEHKQRERRASRGTVKTDDPEDDDSG